MSTLLTEPKQSSRRGARRTGDKPKGKPYKETPSVTEGKPVPVQPDAEETSEKLDKAKAESIANASHYDPTLATAGEVGVGTGLVSRAVQSLRQYASMIGANPETGCLFIIGRGSVTLPPLRKVWDKCASILSLEPLSTGEYSDRDKSEIRKLFNATKAAHKQFIRGRESKDSHRSTLRGVKTAEGVKYSASETYSLKITDPRESEVLNEARLATAKLTLATAKKLMGNPEKLATSKSASLFSAWFTFTAKYAKERKVNFAEVPGWPEWVAPYQREAIESFTLSTRFAFAEWKRLAKLTLSPEGEGEAEE